MSAIWTPEDSDAVAELSDEECWSLLAETEVGRLAASVANVPDIFPVNHVVDGHTLLVRTAEGTKLLEMTINSYVAYEIDGWDAEYAWSVVVRGNASVLDKQADILRASSLGLRTWAPTLTTRFVRITPMVITGRRIRRDGVEYWV